MPNPFAAKVRRDAEPSFPEARLRRLGATDDDLATAKASWDTLTTQERADAAAAMAGWSDAELADAILESREDQALTGVVTPQLAQGGPGEAGEAPAGPDTAGAEPAVSLDAVQGEFAELVERARAVVANGQVSEVLKWIGTDTRRALAVEGVERAAAKPRKTVLSYVEKLTA